ncbi:hypothetical protein [Neolewinella sp.]|uniref:hypothetical protein n=1 Tax=Neolewinella sp. TaxID=2993543 RepID=UPI003B524397
MHGLEEYCLLNYDRHTLFICYIAATYWRILVAGLIVLFIFHFIVRALWIGLVGLNSVYPGGFRPNERFSPHFQQKLREEYGDVDGFISRLDRLGSGLFGIGFGIAGVFLNFGLLGVVFVLLHGWLMGRGMSPDNLLLYIALLLSPLLLLSLFTMVLHTKRYRESAFARRYLWPLSNWQSRFTYPMARRYITTSLNIVTSYYADSKAFAWYFLLGMVAMVGLGIASSLGTNNIRFFIDPVYHRMANDSTRVVPEFVEGSGYGGIYYRPVLPKPEDISGQVLEVWVPLPARELVELDARCAIKAVERGELERTAYDNLRRQRTLDCAKEYMSIQVNGKVLQDYRLVREYKNNAAGSQFGVRAFLEQVRLKDGLNVLGVATNYPHEDSGARRETYTVFYHDVQKAR